jgi:hypothetical protein
MAVYDFTGTDGDPIPLGLTVQDGGFEIQNNKLEASADASLFTQNSKADGSIDVTLNPAGNTTTSGSQIIVRYNDDNNYICIIFRFSDGDIRLYKREGGSFTQLGSGYVIPSYNNTSDYDIDITTLGSSIEVSVEGVVRISTISTFNQTEAKSGVKLRYANSDNIDNLTITEPSSLNSLTFNEITYPYQRTGVTTNVDLHISWTGSPTSIEYSVDGGSWVEGDDSPSGGESTISVPLPIQTSNVAFRFSNDVLATDSANVVVGDIFAVIGQSNGQGAGTNFQTFSAAANSTAYNFGNNNVRSILADPYDANAGQIDEISRDDAGNGSWAVRFAHYQLQANDVPIAFIPCCKGGSTLARWQKTSTDRLGGLNLYESMERRINAVGGKIAGVIFDQGESDAKNTVWTLGTQYESDLTQLFTDIQTSFPCKIIIRQLQSLLPDRQGNGTTTGEVPIRAAQNNVASAMVDVYISASMTDIDLADEGGDGLHFKTDAELDLVGSRMSNTWQLANTITSTLNMTGTNTPDGTYSADIYNNDTKTLIETRVITFSDGDASEAIPLDVGSEVLVFIEGDNPPVTGLAYIGVTE